MVQTDNNVKSRKIFVGNIIKVWVFNLEGDVDIKKSSQYANNKFALEEATGYQGKDRIGEGQDRR